MEPLTRTPDVDLPTLIVGFLVFHENVDFCDACLAGRLGISRKQAGAAAAEVAASAAILRGSWVCHGCRQHTIVTRALPNRTFATTTRTRRRQRSA